MRIVSILAGILLLALMSFAAGMWTREKNWQPWQRVSEIRQAIHSYRRTGMLLPDRSYSARVNRDAARFAVAHPDLAAPGHLLVNRFDPFAGRYAAELLDGAGDVQHRWDIDYSRLVEGGAPAEFVHTATALPDGGLLVNFDDGHALARLDSCSNPVWARTDFTFHHSIERDERGGFWTWAGRDWDGALDQYMLRFDEATGDTLESISLVNDILSDPGARLMMTLPEGFDPSEMGEVSRGVDLLHPNDVEPLPAAIAAAFPGFNAGDLLFSMRNTHMIGVIDRQTHRLKWSAFGPWRDQHDPDFTDRGTISVFSNNQYRFRSSVLEVAPEDGGVRDMFEGSGARFDSYIMGKTQQLGNGNLLVVSSIEGRVLELGPDGQVVREFNNIINGSHNAVITHAELIPPGYFASLPACGTK